MAFDIAMIQKLYANFPVTRQEGREDRSLGDMGLRRWQRKPRRLQGRF